MKIRFPLALLLALYALSPLTANASDQARGAAPHAENYLPGPYPAELIRVIDGDSIVARIRIWLGQDIVTTVRLQGLDTAELKSRCAAEKELALAAKSRLEELIGNQRIEIYDIHRDKYGGRVLAHIRTKDQGDVSQVLISENLARPYAGKKRGSWCQLAQAN